MFIGTGGILVFDMVTTMFTEIVPQRSALLIALNSLGRISFYCLGAAVAQPLISSVSNRWLSTGLTVIAAASSLVIVVSRKFGQRWKENLQMKLYLET